MANPARRSIITSILFVLVLSVAGGSTFTVQAATNIFINEIHYDNTGGDSGEGIEVAGPSGTDLTGWSLVPYNGNGGGSYSTTTLSGTIPDQDNGFGTLSFPISGLQNGSPDGIALVDAASTVIQFLSYEGSFTATDGPANGQTSTDIGVTEGSGSAVGDSLQLTGSGTQDTDFTWSASSPNSFGSVNTGQTFSTPAPNIVINEIMQNPSAVSDNAGEWFELYNPESTSVDIDGWTIADNGTDSHVINNGGPLLIPAGGYLVVGNNTDSGTNGGVTVSYDYGSWFLANGDDEILLLDGSLNEIDRVEYDGGPNFPDPTGASMSLSSPSLDNNVGANWCTSTTSFGAGDLGTPGAANNCGLPLPNIIINEVDADQTGTDTAEFIELYDGGAGNTSLTGLTLVLFNGSDDASYLAFDLDGFSTDIGGFFVLCGDAGNTADCDYDVSPDSNLIQNGADAVALYADDATSFPNDTPVTTTNLLDALVYDTNDGDDPGLLVLLNASEPQINEDDGTDSTTDSNQRCPNGSGGQLNTSSYEQWAPTPGQNNLCLAVATGMIINEVDADQTSTDTAEFIELYDGGTGNTSLTGLTLVLFNGSDDASYQAFDLDGFSTDAGGFFVLCGDAGNTANCDYDVSPDSNLIQNGADAVALYIGDATSFPNDTPVTTTNLLDALVYDTNDGDDAGLLVLLNASEPQINEDDGNDSTTDSNQRCPNGAGGQRNSGRYTQLPPSPGAANSCSAIDLEVSLTLAEALVFEGDTLHYTLTISNTSSNQDATNVVVRSYLPAMPNPISGMSFFCNQGTLAPSLNILDWTVGTLGTNASATCTADLTTNTGTDGSTITYNAEVYSVTETTDIDSSPGNMGASPAEDDESSVSITIGTPAACGTSATLISAIQGTGSSNTLSGTHTIEGIVIGDYQTSNNLEGFFVQEEAADQDGNPASSEGMFIFEGSPPAVNIAVNAGDLVRVTGTAGEHYSLTSLSSITSIIVCGTGNTVPSTTVNMPVTSMDTWEQHEGMLITIPETLTATENYFQGQYGEVLLSTGGRLFNPTNVVEPGPAANAMQSANDLNVIQLDDSLSITNPDPTPYLGTGNTLRSGDTLPGLTGVLGYAYSAYEIQPVGPINFTRVNNRPTTPSLHPGTLKVASFNTLNYFVTYGSRGADDASEFNRQRTKIINAIIAMDADVIGLMEIENHAIDSAVIDLVNGLNSVAGAGTYAAINTGQIGTDQIKVALVYRPANALPLGMYAILDDSVDPTFNDAKNRPALIQTFTEVATGEVFTVAVNHFKSKGSNCDSLGDPDTGDGQGNCNLTRTAAANALVNYLATDPTGSSDDDFLIMGDLNAYAKEDPIDAIKAAGYYDLIDRFIGKGAYSYVFGGQAGYLDHALATYELKLQVKDLEEWHINADEPAALDYNDWNPPANYSPDQYRASDHDPVLISLILGDYPRTSKTIPETGIILKKGISKAYVYFTKDVLADGSAQAVNNVANYLLLESQGDGFQTTSCAAATSGVDPADTEIVINSVSYNPSTYLATVYFNNGIKLPPGEYRLLVCGTTSIEDLDGRELNGGDSDSIIDFSVADTADLPSTGFSQGHLTTLPVQPAEKAYSSTTITLKIPKLGVQMPIVGVPLSQDGWDTSWLGNHAGYLEGSAFPTWAGNTVITGHVWNSQNQPGPFSQVKQLSYGDLIQIESYGRTYIYQVQETHLIMPYEVSKAMAPESLDWLTLLTCEGFQPETGSYTYRRIVRAVLIDVQ